MNEITRRMRRFSYLKVNSSFRHTYNFTNFRYSRQAFIVLFFISPTKFEVLRNSAISVPTTLYREIQFQARTSRETWVLTSSTGIILFGTCPWMKLWVLKIDGIVAPALTSPPWGVHWKCIDSEHFPDTMIQSTKSSKAKRSGKDQL